MVYTSHEVRPVIREQSRLNSVLIEAYATSRGRKQLKGIEDVSKKYGFKYGVQTLLSFGGLTSINHPRLHETMISGPIGGILGAAYVGKLIGNDSLICSDMGGTSFDMGVITRGQTRIENEPLMDRFKLNVPTLHLDTIGAGAGMILKVDPLTKKVSLGPESAGSDPGPICFDQRRHRADHRRLRRHPRPARTRTISSAARSCCRSRRRAAPSRRNAPTCSASASRKRPKA